MVAEIGNSRGDAGGRLGQPRIGKRQLRLRREAQAVAQRREVARTAAAEGEARQRALEIGRAA